MTRDDIAMDAEVRTAALRLFRANDDFRRAYADWTTAPEGDAAARRRQIREAEASIDQARMALGEAERRARGLDAPPKTFRLDG